MGRRAALAGCVAGGDVRGRGRRGGGPTVGLAPVAGPVRRRCVVWAEPRAHRLSR